MARGLRTEWAKDPGVKIFSEVTDPEILFWVGCCGSYDARNHKSSHLDGENPPGEWYPVWNLRQ